MNPLSWNPWLVLLIAGLFEIGWPLGLKMVRPMQRCATWGRRLQLPVWQPAAFPMVIS